MNVLVIASNKSEGLPLPSGYDRVTIFVDAETESKPSIKNIGEDGQINVMLATIYLNRLGTMNRVLRRMGFLSTLYVKDNIKDSGPTT